MIVGVEDLNLTGAHFLISLDGSGSIIKDELGRPEMRICDFELLKYFHFFDGPPPGDSQTSGSAGKEDGSALKP